MNKNSFQLTSIEESYNDDFFYIAHLFDRVLLGEKNKGTYKELLDAIEKNEVLELHLFNHEKEIFAVQINNRLESYEPLLHDNTKDNLNERAYKLDSSIVRRNQANYSQLVVREYIDFDKNSHLAYVGKTVLYELK